MDKLLPVLQNKYLNKRVCRAICMGLALLFIAQYTRAQSLGDPIVHITFGSGTSSYAPPLAPDSGYTTYTPTAPKSPDDGQYGIFNTTAGLNPGWIVTTDHTGDPNGYMMVVNASFEPGLFYTRRVDGLCGSTTYQFGAWVRNILRGQGILPDVTFSVETIDGKTVLGSFDSGLIQNYYNWIQYNFTFTMPTNMQSVVVKMTNNAPGGGGNDIAIDDITFRPYGTAFTTAFDNSSAVKFCSNNPQNITLKSLTPLDTGFAQRLQRYDNGQWLNHSLPTKDTAVTFTTPDTPGFYTYRMIKADLGNIDYSKCVVASNTIAVTVVPPPPVSFLSPDTVCFGDTVVIKDQTTVVQGLTITGRTWDFKDGTTSSDQNPTHIYAAPGDYVIKQTVNTDLGCTNELSKPIHVVAPAQIAFDYSLADCATKTLLFADKTVVPEGYIVSRTWDFGDGSKPVVTSDSNIQHKYDTARVYKVILTVKTNSGCQYMLTKNIPVYNTPVLNFKLPEVCVSDVAQFLDSTIVDNGVTVSYLWNFDDANAAPADNISTQKNPYHKYTQAKSYNVTLKINTSDGCEQTLTKTFTVNGANPHAAFNIPNTTVCSNQDIFVVNNSTVDFGNIARLKWDFGDGTPPLIDDNPTLGKIYHHRYAEVNLPTPYKNYNITLTAYSGSGEASCVEESPPQTVTLLPVPQVTLSAPDSVCVNFGNVQFAVQETSGAIGSGTFSGTAISPAGLFDPLKAGVGVYNITYIYTASSGCADTLVHKIKVNPIGTVDIGPDIAMPDYESTTLQPKVSGDGLKFKWTPAIGLSSDTIANPVVKINQDMTYTLTVTNKYGCSVSDQISIVSLHGVVPPNAFTPNGDGINDTWVIKNLSAYKDCTVDVFNRAGQKVFTSVGYSAIGWDGRYGGSDLPVGVYYYIIDPKHGQKVVSGYVTIIR